MRFSSSLVLALPAAALAQQQVPLVDQLKGYWEKGYAAVVAAVAAVPSVVPTVHVPSSPVEAAAAKIAQGVQHELTLENWKQVLAADPTASPPTTQEWVVYVTGGNATCFGLCGNTTKAWNEAVSVLPAKPNSPKFAILDCDRHPVLCNSWSVGPPSLYYFSIPKPLADQSAPAPTVRYIPLSRNATTVETLKTIVAEKGYEQTAPYEGLFHPFTGLLAQFGLAVPFGWVLWGFGKMPSWLPMIAISFFSRSFMGRRNNPGAAAAGGAAPAPQ